MSVPHKSRAGISERHNQRVSEIVVEAIAQTMRQIDFEREHVAYVKRTALEELKQSERRIAALQRQIDNMRSLSTENDRLVA